MTERNWAGTHTYRARPHWLPDFRRLAARLDPGGAFRNTWLERHVFRSV